MLHHGPHDGPIDAPNDGPIDAPNDGRQAWRAHGGVGRATLALAVALMLTGAAAPAAAQRGEAPSISVAAAILAEPASQAALQIQVGPPSSVPNNSFIRLRGLPSS